MCVPPLSAALTSAADARFARRGQAHSVARSVSSRRHCSCPRNVSRQKGEDGRRGHAQGRLPLLDHVSWPTPLLPPSSAHRRVPYPTLHCAHRKHFAWRACRSHGPLAPLADRSRVDPLCLPTLLRLVLRLYRASRRQRLDVAPRSTRLGMISDAPATPALAHNHAGSVAPASTGTDASSACRDAPTASTDGLDRTRTRVDAQVPAHSTAFEDAVLRAETALLSESPSSAGLRVRREELAGWHRRAWDELEGAKTHGSCDGATGRALGQSVSLSICDVR